MLKLVPSYEQFRDIANVTDMDLPYQMAGMSFSETATRSTAKRLRRTRQHLGTYRYDLLVAMRVVNNIEQEMIRAEWENWLLDENSRCRQVQMMLQDDGKKSTPPKRKLKGAEAEQNRLAKEKERAEKIDGLKQWQEEYCGSCKMEQQMLREGRKHLAFG